MRIQHNVMALNAYRNLGGNQSALAKNLEKLSSGYRINRAGDDAAGLAISEKMRAQITGLDAATKNTKDAIGMIKTTEGALQEVQDMMNRMVYLAEQSENGTYDNEVDRAALNDEVTALKSEISRIASTANFNGKKVLDGNLKKINFKIGDSSATGDTLKMADVLTGNGIAAGDTIGTLGGKNNDVNVSTASKATKALEALRGPDANPEQGLISQISQLRGKLGATQNRLEHTVNNLGVMKENITEAESTVRDTDVADEMMKYTKNNILVQSAQAMLAQANQVPQGVLQLLQ